VRLILFDLGDTLEHRGRPRAGARELLTALQAARDGDGNTPDLALLSDYGLAASPAAAARLRREYLAELRALGLASYFKPHERHVTLSSDVGAEKPDPRLFRAAIDRVSPALPYHGVVFVTEAAAHVRAARELGMLAVQVSAPGKSGGEVDGLPALLPVLKRLLEFTPCAKTSAVRATRTGSAVQKSKKTDSAIQSLVSQVDSQRLKGTVDALVAHGTRWSLSPGAAKVPVWIHGQFLAQGYKTGQEVRYQPFPLGAGPRQRNVLCGPARTTRGLILVCAHYDSVSELAAQSAPGADDDASGVAALLELSRLLRGTALKRDVLFAAFGGEEQGLFGSAECADVAAREAWPIDVVINMDMIGYKAPGTAPRITVEYDHGNRSPGNDAAAKAFGLLMAQAARDYTSLDPLHSDIWSSDYMPFETKGFACIGAYNADENPHYHRTTDIASTLDYAHLAEVVKMVLATIALIGG
jgi:FMN phosphatase YigB (HAD superfamily)